MCSSLVGELVLQGSDLITEMLSSDLIYDLLVNQLSLECANVWTERV